MIETPPRRGVSHVWLTDLDVRPEVVEQLGRVLPAAEHLRAERYVSPLHAARFVVGRAVVRKVLAACTGAAPLDLRWRLGPHGKPELEGPGEGLHFSVSKSADRLLVAVNDTVPVGVDLERVDPHVDMDGVARRAFTESEQRDLARLPPRQRLRAAYCCWTRKEAYLKGIGVGLTFGMDGFCVSVEPSGPIVLAGAFPSAEVMKQWSLVGVDVGPAAVAALAAQDGAGPTAQRVEALRLTSPYDLS